MRAFTFLAVMTAALLAGTGASFASDELAWCAYYSGGQDGGGTNCGF